MAKKSSKVKKGVGKPASISDKRASEVFTINVPEDETWTWTEGETPRSNAKKNSLLKEIGIPRKNDITIFHEFETVKKHGSEKWVSKEFKEQNVFVEDRQADVTIQKGKEEIHEESARFSITKCNNGSMVAITLRLKTLNKNQKLPVYQISEKNQQWYSGNASGDPYWIDPSRSDGDKFVVRNFDIARNLWQVVLGQTEEHQNDNSPKIGKPVTGLLVIAGATNSGKSELAKSIIGDYLQRRKKQEDKMLNLITFEDPIEAWRAGKKNEEVIRDFYNNGICYIPRQLRTDTDSLKNALKDSKRQSPECFYVGEIREKDDWKEVIEFASSGHLIVVTTHATNLRETMQRILNATESENPQRRKIIADALCAVIHARFVDFETEDGKNHKVQSPTFWLANSRSRNELVRDGISSVIGNQKTCFSRQQLAIKTLSRFSSSTEGASPSPDLAAKEVIKLLKRIAEQDISEVIG